MTPRRLAKFSATLGGAVWLGTAFWRVADLKDLHWSSALLAFAALVLVPLVIALVRESGENDAGANLLTLAGWVQLPAAMLLLLAIGLSDGWLAFGLAAPWIALAWILALVGVLRIFHRGINPLWALCRDAGLVFMAVGGAWMVADRLGLHPLGFGTDIVQLTAVHFHFAGLVLPVVTGCVLRAFPESRVAATAGWGVLAGVPLVAAGITSAQLGQGHLLELLAALVLASSASTVAVFQLRLTTNPKCAPPVRMLWVVSAASLLCGMSLALLYAARAYVLPLPWLDIPWMRALHGTSNAIGFALCGLVAWLCAEAARRN